MKSNQGRAIWPYLGLLAVLFALAVLAPHKWKAERTRPATDAWAAARKPAPPPPAVVRPEATVTAPPALPGLELPEDVEVGPQISPVAPAVAGPIWEVPQVEPIPSPSPAAPEPEAPTEPEPVADELSPTLAAPPPAEPAAFRPQALMAQLQRLAEQPACGEWARGALAAVEGLFPAEPGPVDRATNLAALESRIAAATPLAAKLEDRALTTELRRMQHALQRRLDVWTQIWAEPSPTYANISREQSDAELRRRMTSRLDAVESLLVAGSGQESGWRNYLKLTDLCAAAEIGTSLDSRQTVARDVLNRLALRRLSPAQREFVRQPAVAALADELRSWLAGTVGHEALIAQVEEFEEHGLQRDAAEIARRQLLLASSRSASDRELAERLAGYYRNANVRLTASSELLNRMLPAQPAVAEPVRDTVVGVPVRGSSVTHTRLLVRLIPDAKRVRIGIEASGQVHSRTQSTSGPVTLVNQGDSTYLVRKLILCGAKGLHVFPAVADAQADSELESISSRYDAIPLVGTLIRNYAANKRDELQPQADFEVRQKVEATACRRIDSQVGPKLDEAQRQLAERVTAPLVRLGLDPTAVDYTTQTDRVAMRFRLAGTHQLGGHTPRPQAPAGNLLSVQVHQSALSNALENLDLAGRTFTLPELYQQVADKLGRTAALPDNLPQNVRIKFATDPLQVHIADGQLRLEIPIEELKHGKTVYQKFTLVVHYRPHIDGLHAGLMREGHVAIRAEHYKGKALVGLRTICSAVFPPDEPVAILPDRLVKNPALDGGHVSQFTLDAGWLGLAINTKLQTARK